MDTAKTPDRTPVLIVDDHPLFRNGLALWINRQKDLLCCGEAGNSASAHAAVAAKKPSAVVMDLRLGNEDGIELIKSLKSQFPALRILVISEHDEMLYGERSLRAGASGYIMKDEATDEVLVALRAILAGELYVSHRMSARLLSKLLESKSERPSTGIESLSDRELQVYQLLGKGLGTAQIAKDLCLSSKTVQTHRESIKHKLGLHSAPELISQARDWAQSHPAPPSHESHGPQ